MFKGFLDDFYDTLFNYRKGLSRIAEERTIWHGVTIYLIIAVVISLATLKVNSLNFNFGNLPPDLAPFFPSEAANHLLRLLPLTTLFLQLVFGPLYFLLSVAVQNFIAHLFAGRGEASALGAVLGYAHLPYVIVAIGGLFSRYTPFNLVGLLTLAAFIWSIWLKIAGIRIVHNFTWGRAALVYFMPLFTIIAAIILFLLLAIVFLFPLALQAINSIPGGVPFLY